MLSPKAELRRRLRTERLGVLPEVESAIQAQARRWLPPLIGPAGRLGIYWPLAGEVDLRGLRSTLGERLALPAVEHATPAPQTGADSQHPGRLLYRAWSQGQPLEPDGCGIPAPPASTPPLSPADLALLLVPALAVDRSGYRLGYGAPILPGPGCRPWRCFPPPAWWRCCPAIPGISPSPAGSLSTESTGYEEPGGCPTAGVAGPNPSPGRNIASS